MCANRTLPIIIGDVNDSPMSDGESTIHVYNYKGTFFCASTFYVNADPKTYRLYFSGQLRSTLIGRVYVTDLDDWDIKDKVFEWKDKARSSASPYFDVSPDGFISINGHVPNGTHVLKVT